MISHFLATAASSGYITSAFKNEIQGVSRIASALTSAKHLCQIKVLHAPGPKASTHSDECCKLRDIIYYSSATHSISNIYAGARNTSDLIIITY